MPALNPVHPQVSHPLDPLTAAEIETAATLAREACADLERITFFLITLLEPDKRSVVDFTAGDAFERRALVGLVDRATGATVELVVRLGDATVESRETVEGVQPPIVFEDFVGAAQAVLEDERFIAALHRRGIDDLELVQVDPLSAGFYPQDEPGRRIVWATPYLKDHPDSNGYARPIEHLRASVDLNSGEVIAVVDDDPLIALSTADGGYATEPEVGGWRTDIAPLAITQPEGPGFTIDGHVIRWQNWQLHAALHPIDGVVLSDVRFQDGDALRQIVHRASISEMVVPYGDPHNGFYWRAYFDAGEYGLGRNSNALVLGCDCLGEIRYLDAVMPDAGGQPQTLTNAVCIHEEDAGVLWKHTDLNTGKPQVRRSRRLVISNFATVGNYDYGFYWSLYQDGTIELEVKLTGIVLTRGVTPEQELRHSTRVAPDLAAPHHQHLFNARLDMAVDGFENTVYEVDLVATDEGPDNPWGQATEVRSTPILRESEGRRHIDPGAARSWKVVNPSRPNHVGEPVGYKLMPFNGPTLLAHPTSSLGKRAGFAQANLWVTRFAERELHAAGEYPNQHPGGAGLPEWTAQDRDLEETDVVLWHTFGVSHAVRTEDWPVMPVERIGFALRPVGFFARNPAVDLPPSPAASCCHHEQ